VSNPTAVLYGKAGALAEEVCDELARAQAQHGPMASGHEAQSVIGEEFHEFTLAVWFGVDQKGRPADPRAEAIQIAAMAMRYILDVADREDVK
jgi:hypothetical protein